MTTDNLAQMSIKVPRRGPRGTHLTTEDAISYQPEGCYTFRMIVKADRDLEDELEAWEAASDEALENVDKEFPPTENLP